MNNWSDRLKTLEAAGWSLTRIGEAIGLSLSSVSDIKHGRSAAPRGMAAVKLYALSGKCRPTQAKKRRRCR